jgi:Zn-dependent oligopeptidase
METNNNQVKVAVLEQRVDDFSTVVTKLDVAIEKLSEVNSNVLRMLAVHEEKISKQEEIDSILFDRIDKLRDKMDLDHNLVTSKIQLLEKKLWATISAIGIILVSTNPKTLESIKSLISIDSGVILRPVATVINESNR